MLAGRLHYFCINGNVPTLQVSLFFFDAHKPIIAVVTQLMCGSFWANALTPPGNTSVGQVAEMSRS